MPTANADVAAVFDEIADLLEIADDNPFRIRAYRIAAREIQGIKTATTDMIAKGEDLAELPGIGADLAAKIKEIVNTGSCRTLRQLRRQVPPGLVKLLKVPGLGPKRVRTLYRELGIKSLAQLGRAARAGRIRSLPRFGPKIEQTILEALRANITDRGRIPLRAANIQGLALRRYLEKIPGVTRVVIAGSYRRGSATVGDLDFVVVARDARGLMDRLAAYDQVRNVLARGVTRASVRLKSGLQVDVRVMDASSLGAALVYFTGSKAHNIALRRLAQTQKLKINEYGVFSGKRRIAGDTEASVYAALGLRWIPPRKRENLGEIEAARL